MRLGGAEWESGGGVPSRKSDLILPRVIRTSQPCSFSTRSPEETASMGVGETVPSGWGGAREKGMGLEVREIPLAPCQTRRDPQNIWGAFIP